MKTINWLIHQVGILETKNGFASRRDIMAAAKASKVNWRTVGLYLGSAAHYGHVLPEPTKCRYSGYARLTNASRPVYFIRVGRGKYSLSGRGAARYTSFSKGEIALMMHPELPVIQITAKPLHENDFYGMCTGLQSSKEEMDEALGNLKGSVKELGVTVHPPTKDDMLLYVSDGEHPPREVQHVLSLTFPRHEKPDHHDYGLL